MKAILISVHAKWCALMMNGKKKVEVRKGTALYKAIQKLIIEDGYADIYVYCTKGRGILGRILNIWTVFKPTKWANKRYNGKVVFKFRCYNVEDLDNFIYYAPTGHCGMEEEHFNTKGMCLTENELWDYLNDKYGNCHKGCAIHISDLEIFDKPKELSEFKPYCDKDGCSSKCCYEHCKYYFEDCDGETTYKSCSIAEGTVKLTKAPQSWCYVEVDE